MPNHITTILEFKNLSGDKIREIQKAIFNSEGCVDFSILVPKPNNIWDYNESTKHEKAFGIALMGMTWNRTNWGTKWNAYECRKTEITESMDGTTMIVTFDTAWSPPRPWFVAILNVLKVDFDYHWLDEGDGDNPKTGAFIYSAYSGESGFGADAWAELPSSNETRDRLFMKKWGQTYAEWHKETQEEEGEEIL